MLEKYLIGTEFEETAALKYDTRLYRITLGGRRKHVELFRTISEVLAGKSKIHEGVDVGGRFLLTFRVTPIQFRSRIKSLKKMYSVHVIHSLGRMLH